MRDADDALIDRETEAFFQQVTHVSGEVARVGAGSDQEMDFARVAVQIFLHECADDRRKLSEKGFRLFFCMRSAHSLRGWTRKVVWEDATEGIPAFLTIVIMPLTVSITDGIAFGFIAHAALKLATGRGREAHWLVYVFAALFVGRYVWLV